MAESPTAPTEPIYSPSAHIMNLIGDSVLKNHPNWDNMTEQEQHKAYFEVALHIFLEKLAQMDLSNENLDKTYEFYIPIIHRFNPYRGSEARNFNFFDTWPQNPNEINPAALLLEKWTSEYKQNPNFQKIKVFLMQQRLRFNLDKILNEGLEVEAYSNRPLDTAIKSIRGTYPDDPNLLHLRERAKDYSRFLSSPEKRQIFGRIVDALDTEINTHQPPPSFVTPVLLMIFTLLSFSYL